MTENRREDWNSHLCAGWVAVWLRGGSKLSTADIMRLTGRTKQGVENMMNVLASDMPIDRVDGKWQWIEPD